jgi:hypothetical protein
VSDTVDTHDEHLKIVEDCAENIHSAITKGLENGIMHYKIIGLIVEAQHYVREMQENENAGPELN